MQISQDEVTRLLRVVESYEALTRILLDRLAAGTPETYLGTMADIEIVVAQQRLQQCGGNKLAAAQSLDIARGTLLRYLQRAAITLVEEPLRKEA